MKKPQLAIVGINTATTTLSLVQFDPLCGFAQPAPEPHSQTRLLPFVEFLKGY